MAYTTINKPSDYFNTKLYTGDGTSSNAITGVGFQPDLTWIKPRSDASLHFIVNSFDETKFLQSQSTSAELDATTDFVSLDSDGFTVKNTNDWTNKNSSTYASWNWLAGGTGVSNTDGSITSTVSANTTSGFSIVSYTGNGSASATIGHGLGTSNVGMIITKNREQPDGWLVYHKSLGANNYLVLQTTDPSSGSANKYLSVPTPTTYEIGNSGDMNTNNEAYIAYCFAEKKGFSKFGSYVGNGSTDGTFVYTGFKPAWLMYKRTDDTTGAWEMWDNKRSTFNPENKALFANSSNAEATASNLDFTSNGFKIRVSSGGINASGSTYIYMAFAENPLVTSTKLPATAR